MGNIARDGAAKQPQTAFPVRTGMVDQTALSGIAPMDPGNGPDASDPNPLGPAPLPKNQDDAPDVAWDQVDGDGDGLDTDIGDQVMDEAVLNAKL